MSTTCEKIVHIKSFDLIDKLWSVSFHTDPCSLSIETHSQCEGFQCRFGVSKIELLFLNSYIFALST